MSDGSGVVAAAGGRVRGLERDQPAPDGPLDEQDQPAVVVRRAHVPAGDQHDRGVDRAAAADDADGLDRARGRAERRRSARAAARRRRGSARRGRPARGVRGRCRPARQGCRGSPPGAPARTRSTTWAGRRAGASTERVTCGTAPSRVRCVATTAPPRAPRANSARTSSCASASAWPQGEGAGVEAEDGSTATGGDTRSPPAADEERQTSRRQDPHRVGVHPQVLPRVRVAEDVLDGAGRVDGRAVQADADRLPSEPRSRT